MTLRNYFDFDFDYAEQEILRVTRYLFAIPTNNTYPHRFSKTHNKPYSRYSITLCAFIVQSGSRSKVEKSLRTR